MTDCRFSHLHAKLEVPLLLAVPAVMTAALLAGIEQAALAMLVVVALVLALFFAGYEASRPGLRQIMPTLVLAALAAAGRILLGPIPDFKPVSAIALIFIVRRFFFVPAFGAHLPDGHPAPDLSPSQSGIPSEEFAARLRKHLHHDDTNTELEVAIEDPKYEDNTDTLLEADPK